MNLELLAMRWLRWEKRCIIVLTERSPRSNHCGEPDVIGVTKDRFMYEIEVKRSLSDFRADAQKPSRKFRSEEWRAPKMPKQFYYLVPNALAHKVIGELPDWAGLMRGPSSDESWQVKVLKPAPIWKPSTKLTAKECSYLVLKMSNQIMSLAEANHGHFTQRECDDGNTPYVSEWCPFKLNFQI